MKQETAQILPHRDVRPEARLIQDLPTTSPSENLSWESRLQAASGQNFSGYIDHDMSELLELARRDPNGVRRAEAYAAYQQLFIENSAALLLYNPLYHYAVSCQVDGASFTITSGPENRFMTMGDWRIAGAGEIDQVCGTSQE